MTRSGLLILCATMGAGLAACGGGGSKDLVDSIPDSKTLAGWSVDKSKNQGGTEAPMTAATKEEGGLLIDGGIEPFYQDGFTPKTFLWQNYFNSSIPEAPVDPKDPKSLGATAQLYVLEMSSADQASALYQNVLKNSEYNPRRTQWEDPTSPPLGTRSRIQDTNTDWWINFAKGTYYVEITFNPSAGPAPDYEPSDPKLKKAALDFAQALASGL
jgi:hypothetical protein